MAGEIVGRRRSAARGQIGGTGADHAPDRPQARGEQAAVRQRADAQRDIDLIVHKMSDPVGQHETDRQYGPRGGDVGAPRRGQLQPLRRPDQQAGVEMFLEIRDLAADGCERKPELPARLRTDCRSPPPRAERRLRDTSCRARPGRDGACRPNPSDRSNRRASNLAVGPSGRPPLAAGAEHVHQAVDDLALRDVASVEGLQLGKSLLDRVHVRAVGRQISLFGGDGIAGLLDPRSLAGKLSMTTISPDERMETRI